MAKLHRPSDLSLKFRLEIHDANGKLERRTRWKRADSWVVGMMGVFRNGLKQQGGGGGDSLVDTGGTTRTLDGGSVPNWAINAGVNVDTWGIQVGTGSTAVTMTDSKLATQIAHGTGSGQLSHGAMSVSTAVTISSTTFTWTFSRAFTNSSGGAITVNEVGIVCQHLVATVARNFLIERELQTLTVNDTKVLTATFTWTYGL